MIVSVKKIYKGKVSLRDYIVTQALKLNEDLVIYHKGESMTLTVEQLRTQGTTDNKIHLSKFSKIIRYKLIDYRWAPNEERFKWETYQNADGEWVGKQVLIKPFEQVKADL